MEIMMRKSAKADLRGASRTMRMYSKPFDLIAGLDPAVTQMSRRAFKNNSLMRGLDPRIQSFAAFAALDGRVFARP
jgi:hypothetical protein